MMGSGWLVWDNFFPDFTKKYVKNKYLNRIFLFLIQSYAIVNFVLWKPSAASDTKSEV